MTRTLYVVEDDDAVRASLQALLSLRDDLTIVGFGSAEAFLDQIATHEPGVLLLDCRMAGMSGLDLLGILHRDKRPFVPIMLTAQGDVRLAVQAMKSGATDFIEKPCDHERLVQSVDAAFEHIDRQLADRADGIAARAMIARLTPRERDVLHGLIRGWPNKVIAANLNVSPRTVEIHRANLMEKLGVRRLPEALRIVFTAGLIDDL